jgi:hypothetical protein
MKIHVAPDRYGSATRNDVWLLRAAAYIKGLYELKIDSGLCNLNIEATIQIICWLCKECLWY